MYPDGELTTLVIGILLATSFGDVALNSSLLRYKSIKIRNLLATRLYLYCIFIFSYGYVFKVNTLWFLGGAIASPALFSFLYARGVRSYLRINLFFRFLAIIFLLIGYPLFSLIFYAGTAMSIYILILNYFNNNLENIRKKIVRPLMPRPLLAEIGLTFFSYFISGYISTSTLIEVVLERIYRLLLGVVSVLGDLIFYKIQSIKLKNKANLYSNNGLGILITFLNICLVLTFRITDMFVFFLPIMGVLTYLIGKFVVLPLYGYTSIISVVFSVHLISLFIFLYTDMMTSPVRMLVSVELGILTIYGLILLSAMKSQFNIK